ncbi:MAG: hypothetical protein HY664_00355, partial [Chloroflexi bacterium]|nr:hypothetical protein [Chloroflexota bacterium]
LDATDTLLSTVATNASGEYSFPSLGPGSYIACEELKAGWQQTYPTSGADCTAVATLGAKGYAFTATSGTDETGNDFGNFEKITKSGVKYNDVNGDGDLTDGIPLSGWDIKLYRDNGSVPGALDATDTLLSTVATNASGEYSFPNLGPGSYIACEVLKAGWQQTYPTSGADCTAVAGLGAKGYAFTAQSGTDETGNDFGNAQLFRLIIFTCSEATGELVKSEVTLSGKPTTFTWENVPAPLAGAGITESQLCSVADGARYNNLPADTYTPSVELPDVP